MRTVAVTLDAKTIELLDKLRGSGSGESRSAIVRQAVLTLADKEKRDAAIYHAHRNEIRRQTRDLVRGQAKI